MSNLIDQVAYAQKELVAIKAGLSGNQQRFLPTVATSQTFLITVNDKPVVISATFALDDFPQLYAAVQYTTGGLPVILQYKAFRRQSLYSWRMTEAWGLSVDYTINCTLISQRAPTTFTIAAET